VSKLSRKCGSLDISQPHWSPQPVTGIALPFTHLNEFLVKAAQHSLLLKTEWPIPDSILNSGNDQVEGAVPLLGG
jgi:hypothetical protein